MERDIESLTGIKQRALGMTESDRPAMTDLMTRHCARRGFRGFRAEVGSQAVGFAYGAPVDLTWKWAQLIERHMASAEDREQWLCHSFAVSELYVDPAWQRRGAGTALMQRLCASARQDRALLTAPGTDGPAQRLYRRLGFADLGYQVRSAARDYSLMGASLPLIANGRI